MSDAGDLLAKLLIVLGPTPEEPPPPPWEEDHDRVRRDWERPESWPPVNRAPPGGVHWMRWFVGEISLCNSDQELADFADRHQQGLVSGSLKVVAGHPWTGAEHPIQPHIWQASGELGKSIRWSGERWVGEETRTPHDLYVIDPAWAMRTSTRPSIEGRELPPKVQNSVAKLIATLVMRGRRGFYHGLASELEREAEALGLSLSDDTIRKWLEPAKAIVDPAHNPRRKS